MPSADIWSGQEVRKLQRFSAKLHLARSLIGRDDHLANLMLNDALEELHGLIGELARPVSKLADGCRKASHRI